MVKNSEESALIHHTTLRVNLRKKSAQPFMDKVVLESQVSMYINGIHYSVMTVSPFEIRELAIGHLIAEGLVNNPDEILELKIIKGRIDIRLSKELPIEKTRIISTECGSGKKKMSPHIWMKPKKQVPLVRFDSKVIIKAAKNLNSSAEIYRETGGTHAAALMDGQGGILAISEDISRHSAVDKVIGKAVLQGLDFKEAFLTSSGRVTSGIIMKIANVGIPVIVSISAPTDKGIKLAEMIGLTLIGFARGKRFNIYTHPERIILCSDSRGPGLCT